VFSQRAESCFHSADGRGAILESAVDERGPPGGVGENGRDHFHTARGTPDNRIRSGGQHDLPQNIRARTTGTSPVTSRQHFGFIRQFFEI